jgi:NTE family protein
VDGADALRRVPAFRELSDDQLAGLLECMSIERVARGQILIRQRAVADRLFIVAVGQFEVLIEGTDDPVAEIGAGEPIGEIGFFADVPRTASVVAVRDSTVLALDRAAFERVAAMHPRIYGTILRVMARRLGETTEARGQSPRLNPVRTLAVVGAGAGPMPSDFVARLARHCSERGRVRIVAAADVAANFGACRDGVAIGAWLAELERQCDAVLCLADPEITPWTRCAVENSNELLLVAHGKPEEPPNAVEALAFSAFPPKRRRLVRLHARRTGSVADTARWTAAREAFMIHHLATEDDRDFRSLLRFLAGEAIGFVAGGGGAHGPAHIGIYRAFRERGFPLDVFGGASVGAGISAGFARLEPPEAVDAGVHEVFVRGRALKRMTFPRYSLLDHRAFDRALQRIFGEERIEDLWTPYFAVATDLSAQALRVIRSGTLWRAVRASCAIPGVLPPMFLDDGHMLVDGAVAEDLPLAAMKSLKSGPNVVIDLEPPPSRPFDFAYDSLPGRIELLAKLANPLERRRLPACPGPANVVQRAIFASLRQRPLPLGSLDLVLRPPPCPGSSYMNWDRHREVSEAAYHWALGTLARLEAEGNAALAAMRRASGIAAAGGG